MQIPTVVELSRTTAHPPWASQRELVLASLVSCPPRPAREGCPPRR
jgi:hypothetical protein